MCPARRRTPGEATADPRTPERRFFEIMSGRGFELSSGRGIDHVVAATRDLDGAANDWAHLGFAVTPRARHPWGTENHLVQLDGSFVEILGLGAGARIPDHEGSFFSFGAYNRDFLAAHGDGLSMLVLESKDHTADHAAFAAAGLTTYAPFGFERIAISPEGEERRVGFDLTFAGLGGLGGAAEPDMGFFTCRQRWPENFWRPQYQRHPNTAVGIAAAVLVAPDPSDFHEGLSAFAGVREMRASSLGLEIATPRGTIEVLTPAAFRWRFGPDSLPVEPKTLVFAGLRFACASLGEAATQLIAGGFTVADRNGAFVVSIPGAVVAFEQAR